MAEPKILCVIQARLNSNRLPGKVLKPLGGQPVLGHVINRCRAIGGISEVVVAAVDREDEAPIANFAKSKGVPVILGSESDVLSRFHTAAAQFDADHVMRITADCPVLDPDLCTGLIDAFLAHKADYGVLAGWPHGLSGEIIQRKWLDHIYEAVDDATDREHVTLWATRQPALARLYAKPDRRRGGAFYPLRLTLDYAADYELLTRLVDLLGPSFPTARCGDIMAMVKRYPDLILINDDAAADWQLINNAIHAAPKKAESKAAFLDGPEKAKIEVFLPY